MIGWGFMNVLLIGTRNVKTSYRVLRKESFRHSQDALPRRLWRCGDDDVCACVCAYVSRVCCYVSYACVCTCVYSVREFCVHVLTYWVTKIVRLLAHTCTFLTFVHT